MSADQYYAAPGWVAVGSPRLVPGRGTILAVRRDNESANDIHSGDIVLFGTNRYRVNAVELCNDKDSLVLSTSPIKEDPQVGVKADLGKNRFDLLPHAAVDQMVRVLTFGAEKYSAENWRKVPGWRWRYYGAALRHLFAWWGGEKIDPESGIHHLAHAMCCVAFMLELELRDDRGEVIPDPWSGSNPPR